MPGMRSFLKAALRTNTLSRTRPAQTLASPRNRSFDSVNWTRSHVRAMSASTSAVSGVVEAARGVFSRRLLPSEHLTEKDVQELLKSLGTLPTSAVFVPCLPPPSPHTGLRARARTRSLTRPAFPLLRTFFFPRRQDHRERGGPRQERRGGEHLIRPGPRSLPSLSLTEGGTRWTPTADRP